MTAVLSLLEKTACIEFLHHQQQRIHAPNMKVTASMMMKKYAQVLPFQILDSMLLEESDKIIPLSACTISEELDIEIDAKQIAASDSRLETWEQLFAHHLVPLMESFHSTTNLPHIILWENIAVRVNSFFRKAIERYPDHKQEIIRLVEELYQLDGTYFHREDHPMRRYLAVPEAFDQQKIRQTCCYFHKLDKKKGKLTHCLVCPLSKKNCQP